MVLEAGLLVAVTQCVVQTCCALEPQLAVEGGRDAPSELVYRRKVGRIGAAGAKLQPMVRRGDLVERGQPAVAGLVAVVPGWFDVDRDLVAEHTVCDELVECSDDAARVVREVAGVGTPQGDLDRAEVERVGARGPRDGGLDRTGAALHDNSDRQRAGGRAGLPAGLPAGRACGDLQKLGQPHVADHEASEQVGVARDLMVAVGRHCHGQRGVAGWEDGGVVDQRPQVVRDGVDGQRNS